MTNFKRKKYDFMPLSSKCAAKQRNKTLVSQTSKPCLTPRKWCWRKKVTQTNYKFSG